MSTNINANYGLCALEITPQGIAFAIINKEDNPEVEFCGFHPYKFSGKQLPDVSQISTQITSLAREHNLAGLQCNWVLHPNFYHITLVDPPNVPRTEYKQAIRWQIKDLISYELEDTAIEIFYPSAEETSPKKIYVVATQNSFLQKTYTAIQNCDLNLVAIDIREFAMRNLLAKSIKTNTAVGLLDIVADSCLMVIVKNCNIQFVRRFPIELANIKNGSTANFAAEIQKSFNYCVTELQQELPTKLIVMPEDGINASEAILKAVGQNLKQELTILNLQETIKCKTKITPEVETSCWAAIGGTLRNFIETQ